MLPLSNSSSYTTAGVSLHVTASPASFEQAEKLEYQNPEEGFSIYESLAGENPEAGYRCGLMLLEGRGTTRDFWQACSQLKVAAWQGHTAAGDTLSKIQKKINGLNEIVTLLSEAGMDNDGTLKISPELQSDLRHRMMMLILSDKNEIKVENSLITYHDITEATDDISSHPAWQDGPGNVAVQDCLKKVTGSFPVTHEGGLEDTPLIMTRQQQLGLVEDIMSCKKGTEKWTITCDNITQFVFYNKERTFLTPVWLNEKQAETYRQRFTDSLLAEGIEEYNQQAQNQGEQWRVGKVTQAPPELPKDILGCIDQFLSVRTKIQLTATSQFHPDREKLRSEAFWENKLQDGVKVRLLPKPSSWNPFASLMKPEESEPPAAKTHFLKSPADRKECHLPLDETGKNHLKEQGVDHSALLRRIENGQLSLKDAIGIQSAIHEMCKIEDPRMKTLMANERICYGFYNYALTAAQFLNALRNYFVMAAFYDPAVQTWLEKPANLFCLPFILDSTHFAVAVRNKWVRDGIDSGRLPVEELSRLTSSGLTALCDPELQKWLEEAENLSFLPLIFDSENFASNVCDKEVREGLTLKLVTPVQVAQLTGIILKALCNPEVQKWLENPKNSHFFPLILESKRFASHIDCFAEIREALTRRLVTPDQVIEPPNDSFFRVLQVQGPVPNWLKEAENLSFLPFILDSGKFVSQLFDDRVRNGLTSGSLTPEQVIQLNNKELNELLDR